MAVLTAARAEEAAHRAARAPGDGWRIMEKDDIGGAAYAPLHEWRVSDVWAYIRATGAPVWGEPGWDELHRIYAATPNGRMGCWACTLVSRDGAWEALVSAGEVDGEVYRRLDAWRRLWLHMSRGRPDLWRTVKKRTVTRGGRTWRHHYSKLKPAARYLLSECLQAAVASRVDDPVLEPLIRRLRLYRDRLRGLEAYAREAGGLLGLDPEARRLHRLCTG